MACIWNEAYGIIYKDHDGNLKGVCIDILNDFVFYVKDKYQVTVTLEFTEERDFNLFLKRVESSKNLLGVSSTAITPARQKRFHFTPYFLINPNVLVTNRSGKDITKLEDIGTSYTTIKVVGGSIHAEYAKELKAKYYPNLVIQHTSSSRIILEELSNKVNMFTILDFSEYLGASRTKPYLVKQNINLDLMDKIGFIMSKQSDWDIVWSEFLSNEYRKSVGYRKNIADNLGSSYATYLANLELK